MKSSTDILNKIRDAYAARYEPEGLRPLSDIYWRGLLLLAFLVLVCVFLYGTWGLVRVLNGLSAGADTSAPPPPPLSRAALSKTIRDFELRRAQFETLQTNPSATIPDPSR